MPAALIPLDYVDAVERAGGRPVLVPPSEQGVDETLQTLDGIVFSGRADIDPSCTAPSAIQRPTPQARRDAGAMALLEAALERDMPSLAVCRGFQLLNVARGGDLVQHLSEDRERRAQAGARRLCRALVEMKDGSGRRRGRSTRSHVTSHHHQGSDGCGEGLVEDCVGGGRDARGGRVPDAAVPGRATAMASRGQRGRRASRTWSRRRGRTAPPREEAEYAAQAVRREITCTGLWDRLHRPLDRVHRRTFCERALSAGGKVLSIVALLLVRLRLVRLGIWRMRQSRGL